MLKYAMKSIAKTLNYHKIMNELSAMSDRDLEDMGIERYQIPCIAKGKLSNRK